MFSNNRFFRNYLTFLKIFKNIYNGTLILIKNTSDRINFLEINFFNNYQNGNLRGSTVCFNDSY